MKNWNPSVWQRLILLGGAALLAMPYIEELDGYGSVEDHAFELVIAVILATLAVAPNREKTDKL